MTRYAFALLALAACGGTVEPVPSLPTLTQDAPDAYGTATDASDAARGPLEASSTDADASCFQCVAAGWVDVCHQELSPDALSCLHCGLFCNSTPDAGTD